MLAIKRELHETAVSISVLLLSMTILAGGVRAEVFGQGKGRDMKIQALPGGVWGSALRKLPGPAPRLRLVHWSDGMLLSRAEELQEKMRASFVRPRAILDPAIFAASENKRTKVRKDADWTLLLRDMREFRRLMREMDRYPRLSKLEIRDFLRFEDLVLWARGRTFLPTGVTLPRALEFFRAPGKVVAEVVVPLLGSWFCFAVPHPRSSAVDFAWRGMEMWWDGIPEVEQEGDLLQRLLYRACKLRTRIERDLVKDDDKISRIMIGETVYRFRRGVDETRARRRIRRFELVMHALCYRGRSLSAHQLGTFASLVIGARGVCVRVGNPLATVIGQKVFLEVLPPKFAVRVVPPLS